MSSAGLSAQEVERYQRHILLPEVGSAGQQKLKNASALVVGLGGLGSPIALYLAAAGIGRLGLADADRVEESNLQRQVVHDSLALGQAKTDSAARRVKQLNPWVQVECHPQKVAAANAHALIAGYDLVLDATDNLDSRELLNEVCVRQKKPFVHGAVYQYEGRMAVFAPHLGGACYRCVYLQPTADSGVVAGIFGALPGMIGSLQAMEALKLLLGIGTPRLECLLIIDSLENRIREISISRRPDCPICGGRPPEP